MSEPEPSDPRSAGSTAAERERRRLERLVGSPVKITKRVFVDRVERDHRESDRAFLRRRIIVGVTLVVGATLLGLSFATEPGEPAFYPLTFALAATWVVGSLFSGRLHLGHIVYRGKLRRPVLTPIVVGLLLAAVFCVGGLIIRQVPLLAGFTQDVLGYASAGIGWLVLVILVVNGVAEELFFRGALFAAIGVRHPVLISTVAYGLATIAGGNPVLVFAAVVLGVVVGLQRRAGGGVLAPILTHVTWSTAMLLLLPVIFGPAAS